MRATLYGLLFSHPSLAARLALERKGIEHRVVDLLPGMHPLQLRMHGFRGATVPAVKIDGRRLQGSRLITGLLDSVTSEPRLFPAEPAARRAVIDAERWGEQALQPVPRRLFRWCTTHSGQVRRWMAAEVGMPLPGVMAAVNAPVAAAFARKSNATDARVRADLSELPSLLDRVDALIDAGTIGAEEPNAADFQIGTSVRALGAFGDLAPYLAGRPATQLAMRLLSDFPGPVPATLPRAWLPAGGGRA